MKTAVVHDGTIHPGGAVRVVIEAARELDADLYVGFSGMGESWWDERITGDAFVLRRTNSGGRLNDLRTARSMLKLDLRSYELVLSSGPAAKFFQPYDNQLHIHYIHHPPLSVLWFTGSLFAYAIKIFDRVETGSVPYLIANSELTATRVRRQYNRSVDRILPPPVDVEGFAVDTDRIPGQLVLVGRLEERKRPEVAIRAMTELPEMTLKVLGDGPLQTNLEREAPENVDFLGFVDDKTVRRTVAESEVGLFLAEREDFGITPIEYMAAGTPVVGVDEPNTNNQIDEQTGVLVDPAPEAVAEGIRRALEVDWDRNAIRAHAKGFSTDRFRAALRSFVREVV